MKSRRRAVDVIRGEPREGGRERGEVCRSKEGARVASHCKASDRRSEAVFASRVGGRSSEGVSAAGSRRAHDRAERRAGWCRSEAEARARDHGATGVRFAIYAAKQMTVRPRGFGGEARHGLVGAPLLFAPTRLAYLSVTPEGCC